MSALIVTLWLAEWLKIEPWPAEYLDLRGEVDLADNYLKLCRGKTFKALSNNEARAIVESNRLNPSAWKMMIDVYLNNKSGYALLTAVDTISRKNFTAKAFRQFNHCQDYAIDVVKDKFSFSNASFGFKSWDEIRIKIPSFQKDGGLSNEDIFESKDVCLAVICRYATVGEKDSRTLADNARKKFPEYYFKYFYTLSLGVDSYFQDKVGKLHPKIKSEPENYLVQLNMLNKMWPRKATPYSMLMQGFRNSDVKLSKQYARKYLALEKRPFRINWINQAKEVLASK